MEQMQIVYHGTSKKNAEEISKEGFKIDTYFATHLEDSLGYGGEYIFEVAYPSGAIPKGAWQFTTGVAVPPKAIISLTKYNPAKSLIKNEVARRKVAMSNDTAEAIQRTERHMRAHPEGYSEAELIAYGVTKRPTAKKSRTRSRPSRKVHLGLRGVQ